jgi:transposase InsO family protein
MVVGTFEEAVARHGRPESVMNDRGSAFWSWRGISRFTALLTELGVDQLVAEHKEHNGKVEVFNANLQKELFDVQRFYDVAEMRRRLAAHLYWYNHARTHHALGGLLVPADRYYGRVEEVLARIEAGAGRDASDLLDLRERCLELFKVTSRGGVAEVWLLGQRLLGATAPQ